MAFIYSMVLPLVDEDKPKCCMCHVGFKDVRELREHQKLIHKEFFNDDENSRREPAPGDVTVF